MTRFPRVFFPFHLHLDVTRTAVVWRVLELTNPWDLGKCVLQASTKTSASSSSSPVMQPDLTASSSPNPSPPISSSPHQDLPATSTSASAGTPVDLTSTARKGAFYNTGLPRAGRPKQRSKDHLGAAPLSPEACASFAQELLIQAKGMNVQDMFYNNPYSLRQDSSARAFLLALQQGGLILHRHR